MKILSLFDGISCARVALNKANISVDVYYASEIDKHAISISKKNWPDIIHVGDVQTIDGRFDLNTDFGGGIDLLIGGSPCQDLSIAKDNREGLRGKKSSLFFEYVRILHQIKPKYFILENVASMPKEAKAEITRHLGVEPIMIDAALVSAQRRKRLFWTNIPNVKLPKDRNIFVKDILESEVHEKYFIDEVTLQNILEKMRQGKPLPQSQRVHTIEGKSVTLQAGGGGLGAKTRLYIIIPEATKKGYAIAHEGDSVDLSFPTSKTRRGRVGNKVKNLMTSQNISVFTGNRVRKLTPLECERLQSVSDNYTEGATDTQRYKMLGNAFNVDVIAHILSSLDKLTDNKDI